MTIVDPGSGGVADVRNVARIGDMSPTPPGRRLAGTGQRHRPRLAEREPRPPGEAADGARWACWGRLLSRVAGLLADTQIRAEDNGGRRALIWPISSRRQRSCHGIHGTIASMPGYLCRPSCPRNAHTSASRVFERAWRPGHSRRAGIIRTDEHATFPSLPGDRHPYAGHPLPDLRPYPRLPARQHQRGLDRALPPDPS